MKVQPDKKWNLVKAGILAGFGLALAGLAIALPAPSQTPVQSEPVAGSDAGPRDGAAAPSGSRDPSLAGLRVSPDAPDTAPIETD